MTANPLSLHAPFPACPWIAAPLAVWSPPSGGFVAEESSSPVVDALAWLKSAIANDPDALMATIDNMVAAELSLPAPALTSHAFKDLRSAVLGVFGDLPLLEVQVTSIHMREEPPLSRQALLVAIIRRAKERERGRIRRPRRLARMLATLILGDHYVPSPVEIVGDRQVDIVGFLAAVAVGELDANELAVYRAWIKSDADIEATGRALGISKTQARGRVDRVCAKLKRAVDEMRQRGEL